MNKKSKLKELKDQCEDAYCKGEFKKSIELCDEILIHDSKNQTAIGYKAKCLHLIGECDEALNILESAVELYPENYHYYDIMAEILTDKKEYDRAIECFEEIFRIGVSDEVALSFIKRNYEICVSLKIDELIEHEKYADAWKYYNMISEGDLKRTDKIRHFKEYVARYTTQIKKRQYHVKISSDELIGFLKENGFKGDGETGPVFLIDVVDKCYRCVQADENIISESKFYDKVNYYPRSMIEHEKIFDDDNRLLYEGYTLHGLPYGFGTVYFSNGNVYREGIFDIKGIVQGKEYYPSGQLRFEGEWSLTRGYGPNAPYNGKAYDETGKVIYSGKFEIKRGGVGWPRIIKPEGFGLEQKERPKIQYY